MLVKVCGMKDRHQIQQLEKLRPDFIGLIFYERSPRFVTEPLDGLPKEVQRVGVFVNANLGYLQEKTGQYRLDLIQLHGNESPKYCRKVRALGCGLLKAFSLTAPCADEVTAPYEGICDFFLFDTPCKEYGGSGKTFDWNLLQSYHGSTPFLLSGGIRPDSLEALSGFRHPRFAGVDLNSGFETAPGVKDIWTLETFITQVKHLAPIQP